MFLFSYLNQSPHILDGTRCPLSLWVKQGKLVVSCKIVWNIRLLPCLLWLSRLSARILSIQPHVSYLVGYALYYEITLANQSLKNGEHQIAVLSPYGIFQRWVPSNASKTKFRTFKPGSKRLIFKPLSQHPVVFVDKLSAFSWIYYDVFI